MHEFQQYIVWYGCDKSLEGFNPEVTCSSSGGAPVYCPV
jgi:hypothetical protein